MKTTTKLAALPLTAMLALTLAACSTQSNDTTTHGTQPPAVATSAAPAPTPVQAPTAAPKAGDLLADTNAITAAEKAGLARIDVNGGGSYAVEQGRPLPASVVKAVLAPTHEAAAAANGFSNVPTEARAAAQRIAAVTGQKVIVIVSKPTADGVRYVGVADTYNADLGHASITASHKQTVSKVNAWVASQKDAASWLVVDATL